MIVELRQKSEIPVIACWIQTVESTSAKEITMVQMLSLLPLTYASYEIILAALSSRIRICLLVFPRTFCSVREPVYIHSKSNYGTKDISRLTNELTMAFTSSIEIYPSYMRPTLTKSHTPSDARTIY